MSQVDRIQELRAQLRQVSGGVRAVKGDHCGAVWPPVGLGSGKLSEWLSFEAGSGAWELAVATLCSQVSDESRWLIIDPAGEISPQTCAAWGIDLTQVVFVRNVQPGAVLWGIEQGLRSRGVDVVLARVDRLPAVAFRRLQLAVEQSQARCLLLRGPAALKETSWADLRLEITPQSAGSWSRRRMRVRVLKQRSGIPGNELMLELDHASGVVRLVSELAHPAAVPQATGA